MCRPRNSSRELSTSLIYVMKLLKTNAKHGYIHPQHQAIGPEAVIGTCWLNFGVDARDCDVVNVRVQQLSHEVMLLTCHLYPLSFINGTATNVYNLIY